MSVLTEAIHYLFQSHTVTVPSDFHTRVKRCKEMLESDYSALVTTNIDFAIACATVDIRIETGNDKLTNRLNNWASEEINAELLGKIPVGLPELMKEYLKERWTSSLIVLNVKWGEIGDLTLPVKLWFIDGEGIEVEGETTQLGDFKYFVQTKKNKKTPLPLRGKDNDILVQKPFARWYDKYPSPYLVRRGTLASWLMKREIKENSAKILSEIIWYFFQIKKGDKDLWLQGVEYDDKELEKIVKRLEAHLKKKKDTTKKELSVYASTFDTTFEEFIPDLKKLFAREIYEQIDRDILSSLGLIEIIEGIGTSRREAILNPKPFIREIYSAINDFSSLMRNLIVMIIEKNKGVHRKYFSESMKIKVKPGTPHIGMAELLVHFRSLYDRGLLSKRTYLDIVEQDLDTEFERRKTEKTDGVDKDMHPPIIVNREDKPVVPDFPERVQEDRKKGKPEVEKFKSAEDESEITCGVCGFTFDYFSVTEEKQGYIKCPMCDSILGQGGKVYFVASLNPEKNLEATLADLVQAPVDITEKYIRIRQKDPSLFQKNSFRTITLGKGIKAIIARLKGQTTTTIQSYLFDKTKWTLKEAKKWIKEHKK